MGRYVNTTLGYLSVNVIFVTTHRKAILQHDQMIERPLIHGKDYADSDETLNSPNHPSCLHSLGLVTLDNSVRYPRGVR